MKTIGFYGNDFFQIKDELETLRESVKRILMTSPGERVNNPSFGSRLKDYIFEFESYLIEDIQSEITKCINKWEPRVDVSNVSIEKIDNFKYYVNVDCIKKGTAEMFSLNLAFNL